MNVAIIPARGGSKRIPKKNIRFFAGKPIIAYSIQAARESKLFDRIIVSTDSAEVGRVAQAWGAEVPFQRPEHLADDYATTVDVLVHAVEWLKANGGCDCFCCIYPTAPFVLAEHLRSGFQRMQERGVRSAVAVCRFSYPIQRALKIDAESRLELLRPEHVRTRSQDLTETYHDAAQFYWGNANAFLKEKTLLLDRPAAVVLPSKLVHDIATPEDWDLAELKFRALRRPSSTAAHLGSDLPPNTSRIVLGTAQLGFNYGIANRAGKPNALETKTLLCMAWAGGVRLFDTAQAYGDSEYVLGDFFAGSFGFADARFISKLHPDIDMHDPQSIRRHVAESLRRLKISRLWCLMLHREQHYDEWSGPLGGTLRALREEEALTNLGVSVYSTEYAKRILLDPDLSMVEVPSGIFDRRMLRAGIPQLAAESHKTLLVRSIFLQGLAFLQPSQVPLSVPHGREAVTALRQFCSERGLDPREFAYDYVRSCYPDALIVIGAETSDQVALNCRLADRPGASRELVEAWDKFWPQDFDGLYDPSKWISRPDADLSAFQAKQEAAPPQ